MNRSAHSIIPNNRNDNNSSTMNTSSSTLMDQSTRICRRITFLYANDMTNSSDTIATTFHYLQQSSVPFHQSAYTIHEYTCGDSSSNHSVSSSSLSSSAAPKLVATTPISSLTTSL